jgi:hypothetical protein
MCPPPERHKQSRQTRCVRSHPYCTTRLPSSAGAGGGWAPCGPCVRHSRRVTITAGRARAVPPARRDPPSPAGAGGRAPCGSCVCRRRHVTIAAGRPCSVPPARHDRPPQPVLAVLPMCVPPPVLCDRGGTSTLCAARATRPPLPAGAGAGPAEGARSPAFVCTAGGVSRSQRDEHALCRPRDATALSTARSFSPAVFTACASVRGFRVQAFPPCHAVLQCSGSPLRTPVHALVPPPPRGAAPALARSCMRRSRVLCSLFPDDRRQQPQPQLLLSADSALTT